MTAQPRLGAEVDFASYMGTVSLVVNVAQF